MAPGTPTELEPSRSSRARFVHWPDSRQITSDRCRSLARSTRPLSIRANAAQRTPAVGQSPGEFLDFGHDEILRIRSPDSRLPGFELRDAGLPE